MRYLACPEQLAVPSEELPAIQQQKFYTNHCLLRVTIVSECYRIAYECIFTSLYMLVRALICSPTYIVFVQKSINLNGNSNDLNFEISRYHSTLLFHQNIIEKRTNHMQIIKAFEINRNIRRVRHS